MKKGDRPNAAEEFLYKLSGQLEFNEYLTNYRKRIGVPKYGLGKSVNWEEGWDRLISDKKTAFIILISAEHLQMKFKIPAAYAPFLRFYICFGYIPKEFNKVDFAKIFPPLHLLRPDDIDEEKELRMYFPYEPYAKLLIFGTSRKSDVIKFITENWDGVEEILKKQGWTRPKTIRRTIHKERNLLIKELWRKSTIELQKEAGSTITYKEMLIQKILEKTDKKGYKITDGQVRKLRYWK